MAKELTVKRMISFNGRDGDYVDFDTISEEQKELFQKSVSEKLSVIAGQVIQRILNESAEERET